MSFSSKSVLKAQGQPFKKFFKKRKAKKGKKMEALGKMLN